MTSSDKIRKKPKRRRKPIWSSRGRPRRNRFILIVDAVGRLPEARERHERSLLMSVHMLLEHGLSGTCCNSM